MTGKAGRTSDDTIEVENGRAACETLTFQARENPDAPLMTIKLMMQGEELVGHVQLEVEGPKMTADLKFKRQ